MALREAGGLPLVHDSSAAQASALAPDRCEVQAV